MRARAERYRVWTGVLLLVLFVLLGTMGFVGPVAGGETKEKFGQIQNLVGPGWVRDTLKPISPETGRFLLETREAAVTMEITGTEAEATPEIIALARALKNDPKRIFDYVHNRIDYVPTYGAINGATATMYAGRGNDCDQASLFVALMRQAEYDAKYVTGEVTYTADRLANWVGADASVAHNVLANGGVPIEGVSGGWKVSRVWAQAYIDGTWYTFDPAMKQYQNTAGLDNLGTILNYDQTTFMTRAQYGAAVDADSARDMNEANIRADLTTYGMNLVEYIRDKLPTAGVDQIMGGRKIIETEMTTYPTDLPHATAVTNQSGRLDAPPAGMYHTLSITHAGTPTNFNTVEIAGRRLTIFLSGTNAALFLDGTKVREFAGTSDGTSFTITVNIDHPIVADQAGDFTLVSGTGSYAVVHDFDGVSSTLINRRNVLLSQSMFQGDANASEPVRGEALSLVGQEWFYQVALYDDMVDSLNSTRTLTHHRVGVVGQETGFYIDIPLAYASMASIDGESDVWLSGRAQTMMDSAFEHGVLKQLQAHQGWDSVSTIRMLQFSNNQGTTTYLTDTDNWNTGTNVRSQLVNYAAGTLTWFDRLINEGYELVLPKDGQQQVGNWQGVGYIQRKQSEGSASMGMIISGGYAGGYTTQPTTLDPSQHYWDDYSYSPWDPYRPNSRDPVDMVTGAFLYDHTDLSIGPSDGPLGLRLARSYTSHSRYTLGPLGYGWTHNYQMTAGRHSGGPAGLGKGGAVNAAAIIAFTHVALDLLENQLNIQGWTASAIATKWAMDQLLDNAVTVKTSDSSATFLKLADGSYNPPPGRSELLTVDGNGYHLQERFGARYDYDPAGRLITWKDANANTLTFAYDESGRLTRVTNALGNALTLAYTDDRLTSVTNETRTVQYAYTGDTLTTFRDARNTAWGYQYDENNQMTRVKKADPATTARVTNGYDAFGRVQSQTDAQGNQSTFYFSGYRNIENFPDGGEVTYFFDLDGRFIARKDQLGKRTRFGYNGLGRLTRMTDRLADAATFSYDQKTGRLATVTNGRGGVTTYTYALRPGSTALYVLDRIDHPDGAYETFTYDANGNLLTWRDTGGGTWSYTYNARGQILTMKNPANGTTTYAYNADGTLKSVTDSDPGIGTATYSYDAHKRVTQIAHPGGAIEQFQYNPNNLLTQYTDRLNTVYTYTYDLNNNLTSLTRAFGTALAQTEQYQYDDMDRLIQGTDASDNQTQFDYTSVGGLRQISYPGTPASTVTLGYDACQWAERLTDPDENLWQATRDDESIFSGVITPEGREVGLNSDAMGGFTGLTDAKGKTITAQRDAMERVIKVTDRLNRETTIGRDTAGRITTITLPVIGTVAYTRNALGLVTRITDPRGKFWDFDYTPVGRITEIKDPNGKTWSYGYDSRGRITTITYPDRVVETRTYDNNDHLIRRLFSTGLDLTYTYDELGRLTATGSTPVNIAYDERNHITATTMGGAVYGASYDARRRMKTVTYAGEMTVTYTYDARGLVTKVEDNKINSWIQFAYDQDGLLVGMTRRNGVSTQITRNANGRIEKIKHGDKGEIILSYDDGDQITKIIENLPLDVAAFVQPELVQYTYDAASQINATGFAYDARGRRTADPKRRYTWDAADRLTRIVEGATSIDLQYTASGEVSRRTVNGTATDYFYNYAFPNRPIMAEKRGGIYNRFYVYTPDGRLLYFVDTPTTTPAVLFYHFNHIGTTLFLTTEAGAVVDSYGYSAYGQLVAHQGGSSDQPFTFVGEHGVRQEGPSGLFHMRARYYDSRTAQFVSRDPIWPDLEDPKAINPYQYAGQNPLSFIDPSGLEYYVDGSGNILSPEELANFRKHGNLYGRVSDEGSIDWVNVDRSSHGSTRLPANIDDLRAGTNENNPAAKPQQVTQPPSPDLGDRASSGKPQDIIQYANESIGKEDDVSSTTRRYTLSEYGDDQSSHSCCEGTVRCSILDRTSPLVGLLLLVLASTWLLVRRYLWAGGRFRKA